MRETFHVLFYVFLDDLSDGEPLIKSVETVTKLIKLGNDI